MCAWIQPSRAECTMNSVFGWTLVFRQRCNEPCFSFVTQRKDVFKCFDAFAKARPAH